MEFIVGLLTVSLICFVGTMLNLFYKTLQNTNRFEKLIVRYNEIRKERSTLNLTFRSVS